MEVVEAEGERMVLISFHLPRRMLEDLDWLVRTGFFKNRSEAIRSALEALLEKYRDGPK